MKTSIVRIGNSRGVRIPKALLQQSGLDGEVEIRCEGNSLVIEPSHPRAGWREACQEMAACGEDELIGGDWPPTKFDQEEWQW